MFKEICTLVANETGLVIGNNLFVGHRPQSGYDRCVVAQETEPAATVFELPDRADFVIQFISRAKTYFDAREDIWRIHDAMHGSAGWNMPRLDGSGPDYIAWAVEALGCPYYVGQDTNNRFEFTVNILFRMAQASCSPGPSAGA